MEDICVVIRSVGERTTELCRQVLTSVIISEQIFFVKDIHPFSEAVRKTFEIGIKSKKKWLLAIDADVLLFPKSISEIINAAEKLPQNLYMYEGLILDKFSLSYRPAGHHLYRISHLNEALTKIPKPGTQNRAESYTRDQMVAKGFLFVRDNVVYGIHDFEQSYFDIYRTCFFYTKKHPSLIPTFFQKWYPLIPGDQDFLVALRGLTDGIIHGKSISNDARIFESFYSKFEKEIELEAKADLLIKSTDEVEFIDSIHEEYSLMVEVENSLKYSYQFNRKPNSSSRFEITDFLRKVQWKIGRTLTVLGKKILKV